MRWNVSLPVCATGAVCDTNVSRRDGERISALLVRDEQCGAEACW
jgi:hypothetical protein